MLLLLATKSFLRPSVRAVIAYLDAVYMDMNDHIAGKWAATLKTDTYCCFSLLLLYYNSTNKQTSNTIDQLWSILIGLIFYALTTKYNLIGC